jgi:hypothetical protein
LSRATVAVAGLAVSSIAAQLAAGSDVQSRVIDRTLSCPVAARAAVRTVNVTATTGTRLREDASKWKILASAGARDSTGSFAGVSAGNPLADLEPGFPAPPFRVYVAAGRRCTTVARMPFSRGGLAAERPSPLGSEYECLPGRRALVRVRAEFRAPTTLRQRRFAGGVVQLVATGTVLRGQLAVRSATGRPLAYAEVDESGRARLFVARSCIPD